MCTYSLYAVLEKIHRLCKTNNVYKTIANNDCLMSMFDRCLDLFKGKQKILESNYDTTVLCFSANLAEIKYGEILIRRLTNNLWT